MNDAQPEYFPDGSDSPIRDEARVATAPKYSDEELLTAKELLASFTPSYRAALFAASAEQPEVQGAWKLVPVEATPEMMHAATAYQYGPGGPNYDHAGRWKAMLAAAPAAPGVRVDEAMANRFMMFFNCEAESTTGTRLYTTERANVLNALTATLLNAKEEEE